MDALTLPLVILGLFVLAFSSGLARLVFESAVNLFYRRTRQQSVVLSQKEAAIVIPCHNSEDSIEGTVRALPDGYIVYCVANNCSDDTVSILRCLHQAKRNVKLIEVEFPGRSKTQAVVLGVIQAVREGFTHVLILDDDVCWPAHHQITVLDKTVPVTAIPVIPQFPTSLLEGAQVMEYIGTSLTRRSQILFSGNTIWASGAAAIYRCDTFLEVMRSHDGEFAGEDVQCSYLHHYFGHKIDFLLDTIVTTAVPRGFSAWWRQRAHCWDISFMFLHIDLLLRVLLLPKGQGPGWWIRCLTFYRVYDPFLVLIKIALPLAVVQLPVVLLFFLATSYLTLAIQCLTYPMFFTPLKRQWNAGRSCWVVLAFLVFPAYQVMTWVSRLTALPRSLRRKLRPRPLLAQFMDTNFLACTRVHALL